MSNPLLEQIVRMPLDNPGQVTADVPCGSCSRCCKGNSIVMLIADEGDDVESYQHEIVNLPGAGRGPILKRKPNGECVYLGERGCTIHARRPAVCRVFDCRGAYLNFMDHPRQERRRMIKEGYIDKKILDVGKALLARDEGAAA